MSSPLFTYFLLLLKREKSLNLDPQFLAIKKCNITQHLIEETQNNATNKDPKGKYNKLQIFLNVATPLPFSHTTATDLKGHVQSTNYTFMAETPGEASGSSLPYVGPLLSGQSWLIRV